MTIKADSRQKWETDNPVLADGDVGVELDRSKVKIGDGVKTWNQLPTILINKKITIVIEQGSSEPSVPGAQGPPGPIGPTGPTGPVGPAGVTPSTIDGGTPTPAT